MRPGFGLRVLAAAALCGAAAAGESGTGPRPRGIEAREDYFPLAVWLQAPRNAPAYKAIGINLYVGLWKGPTEAQIAELRAHGMPVICDQNDYARASPHADIIVGWMHGDEPDNAQPKTGGGYGPPITPDAVRETYRRISAADPSRPTLLNLGQGVAWDGWYGRGTRTNHPEDYLRYVEAADIISFDIYPACHAKPAVAGKLWYVAVGVNRLVKWTEGRKTIWSCLECTNISNLEAAPSPRDVRAEAWMAIIHGARGLIYFCHRFAPSFIEAGLLADREMSAAVGALNGQIRRLAPVINAGAAVDGAAVAADPPAVDPALAKELSSGPIAMLARRYRDAVYIFAVRMEGTPARGAFTVPGVPAAATATVIDEDRKLPCAGGAFTDDFEPYAVHLYEIR